MANYSADDEINPLGFEANGMSWETREVNVNPMFSSQHEDYRAESLDRMVEEVPDKIDLTSGHMSQMEESFSKLPFERTVKENGDDNVPQIECRKAEERNSGFPLTTIVKNAEERGCMSHKVAKLDKHNPESLCEDARMQNDKNSGRRHQPMAKRAESNYLLPQLIEEENDKKEPFMSQQMLKSEILNSESHLCMTEENNRKYGFQEPNIFSINGFKIESASGSRVINDQLGDSRREDDTRINLEHQQITRTEDFQSKSPKNIVDEIFQKKDSNIHEGKQGKYFYYDSPLYEETGMWIPVSVPPMSESDHQEWARGFCSNGGYLPEGDAGWGHCIGGEKELTMWDVVAEMVLAARGKVNSLASGDMPDISWISGHLIEQAWKEMAQTLTESSLSTAQEILEAEPPKWLPDSTASTCMLCSVRFHPIMCTRHHCRFCGGIFCGDCTRGRSLLPQKFLSADPQRVCDVCCVRLESVQPYLMDQVSRAAQLPTHDLTDLSTLRSWLNFPWGQSMEHEIYKATNTIRGYSKVGFLKPEKRIPEAILQHAKGLAILTVVKVGVMVTYNIGTGLVIARREDGSWSPPSAISSFGVGWGAQAGGELTDLIIVLRTEDAIRTFSGTTHLSVGAGASAAIGIIGRTAEADIRAGTSGYAACYTYSCSKGAFIGCSLEGSIVTTRAQENCRFYGSQSIAAADILLGSLPRPPAASILYRALAELYEKL